MINRLTHVIREEIVRQYRDDERSKCPAGRAYYEESISPYLIALCVLKEINMTEAQLRLLIMIAQALLRWLRLDNQQGLQDALDKVIRERRDDIPRG